MLNPQFKQKATQKWIVDLNVRVKIIAFIDKSVEEIVETLCNIKSSYTQHQK